MKELLKLAEMDIDAQNPIIGLQKLQRGGLGDWAPTAAAVPALTGLRIAVDFTFSNFRPMGEMRPFDFTLLAVMTVKATSVGSFVTPRESTIHRGTTSNFDSKGTVLSIRGVNIEFQAKGLMGKADGYTGMMALMSCLVMVGVATAIVDVVGAFIYDSFKDDKIEDDSERQHLEHMILNIETSGVPFKNDDFEFEPGASVKKQIDELTRDIQRQATLLHHMSGELAAAGLNSHTMHMADLGEGVQSARYECVLKVRTARTFSSPADRRRWDAARRAQSKRIRTSRSAWSPTRTTAWRECRAYRPRTSPVRRGVLGSRSVPRRMLHLEERGPIALRACGGRG